MTHHPQCCVTLHKVVRRTRRRLKNVLHGTILTGIVVSLAHDGAKAADWLFFLLSIIVEFGG